MKFKKVAAVLLLFFFSSSGAYAYWVWNPQAGKFVNAEGAGQGTPEEAFDYAMKFFKEKNLDEAEKKFREIAKNYPNSRMAPEAQYRLGTIYEEKNDYLKAFRAYKRLVESYPQSDRFNEVIEREFRIGNLFLSGRKGKLVGLEILPSVPRAVEVFKHIVEHAPFSEYGDQAQFHLGLSYKKGRHYPEAVEAFKGLIDQHPQSALVPQARFQLAETSYLRSAAYSRDQRALDEASTEVGRFLEHYPNAEASEKAAKLRQVIDEKNAEKSFRIGLYYEKENYLQSALIYYSEVVSKYPDTQWGQKAADKLKSLKEPGTYLSEKEKQASSEVEILAAKLQTEKDDLEHDRLKRKLERAKTHVKVLEKSKKESLDRRQKDLERRERELKEKFKNLEKKRKLMGKNPSEDFKKAIDRWHASLVGEQDSLLEEKKQLGAWREELGVEERKGLGFLPFTGEPPSELDKVRRVQAKKLYKLSEEKKSLLEEKEVLYKHHGEVSALLNGKPAGSADDSQLLEQAKKEWKPEYEKLTALREKVDGLEKKLDSQSQAYEKQYGKPVLSSIARGVKGSLDKSFEILNPFDGKEDAAKAGPQKLGERQMHLKEKIAAQQNLVQTLSEAFNAELAFQEQKKLLANLETEKNPDPKALRKQIKTLEREIRGAYQDIEDRHEHKQKLLGELNDLLKKREAEGTVFEKTGRAVTAPARGAGWFFRSFVFGLPHSETEISEAAAKVPENQPDAPTIRQLEHDIELENLMIEAKSRAIPAKEKQLEILRANASLKGGYNFRSVFIKVPYQFVGEAITNARRVVPKKNRQEFLINRLNEETKNLEAMKAELTKLNKALEGKEAPAPAAPAPAPEPAVKAEEPQAAPQKVREESLKKDLKMTEQELNEQKDLYAREKKALEAKMQTSQKSISKAEKERKKTNKRAGKREEKLRNELKEIQDELRDVIKKENELEGQETSILEKRIQRIDHVIPKINSRVISQDLLTERERMEERVSQLSNRKDFLSQELKRFEFTGDAASAKS